jgi:hypothetical protein
MARLWVPSGVAGYAALLPALVAGPTINVAVGSCWLDGHFAELTSPASIPASANGLLVVRFTPADNRAELLFRSGITVPTQTDPTWELPIAAMVAGALQDRRVQSDASGAASPFATGGALPAAPYDRQTIRYLDAYNAIWTMTYVAGAAGAYKWSVNAPPMTAFIAANENGAVNAAWADLATPGPDIIIPLPGVYHVAWGFHANTSGATSLQSMGPVMLPGTDPATAAYAQNPAGAATGAVNESESAANLITFAAAGTVRARYKTTGAAGFYDTRWLTIMPRWVG